jgi:hypothetical protein
LGIVHEPGSARARTYRGDAGWYTSGTFNVDNVGARFALGDWDGDGWAEPAMFYD